MIACVIMHNMIIEDVRGTAEDFNYEGMGDPVVPSHKHTNEFLEFMHHHHAIRNRQTHNQLQDDLVEHLWQQHGGM